jgi:Glycosyl hydrolases family 15
MSEENDFARAGLSPFGQVFVQFMIGWQAAHNGLRQQPQHLEPRPVLMVWLRRRGISAVQLADNYMLQNRDAEASALFERLLSVRNDVGLLAEEYDPQAQRQVGNFPQAFSHLDLVGTALNLHDIGPAQQRCDRSKSEVCGATGADYVKWRDFPSGGCDTTTMGVSCGTGSGITYSFCRTAIPPGRHGTANGRHTGPGITGTRSACFAVAQRPNGF